jgi:hypothetical protein
MLFAPHDPNQPVSLNIPFDYRWFALWMTKNRFMAKGRCLCFSMFGHRPEAEKGHRMLAPASAAPNAAGQWFMLGYSGLLLYRSRSSVLRQGNVALVELWKYFGIYFA